LVHGWYVYSFLCYAGGYQYLIESFAEVLDDLFLFFLGKSFFLLPGGLSKEFHRLDAFFLTFTVDLIYCVSVLAEHYDLLVLQELLLQDLQEPGHLGVFDFFRVGSTG